MDRDEIIRRVRRLEPEQLEMLLLFLDRLQGRSENQTDDPIQDQEAAGSD